MGEDAPLEKLTDHDNAGETPALSHWRLANGRLLALDKPRVMFILNVTPDSFSDGGAYDSVEAARDAALRAIDEGADIIDVGGESTRPGAERVGVDAQILRVTPVIEAIRMANEDTPISVDTTLSEVAAAALDAGADAINDVSAGRECEWMLGLAARREAGLILMHRLLPPDADSYSTEYDDNSPEYGGDVVGHVKSFLLERAAAATEKGVSREAIVLDPGFGFGKTVEQNFEMIRRFGDFTDAGYATLAGVSRKSFLGAATGTSDPKDRVDESVSAAVALRLGGASIFRVHDVAAHARALADAEAIRSDHAIRA